ncbi:ABC transporter substrate-binding protein [Alteribacter aurantiacus]|uniref:ABC transporter substrate-binding protein n=1 Tax=Alteribacter aurantiacus TaxID=254410 RepID=UPI00040E8150|nr:ABC transporter substrate-binding protein [Alteribacter aurantiacus]
MKKQWLGLTVLSGLLVLGACNTELESDAQEENGEKTESSTEEVEAEENDVVDEVFVEAGNPAASPELALNRGNTVVVGLQEPGGVFTPHFNTSGYDGNVQSVMFPPLVDINPQGEPIPRLAEDWEISEDGKTYTYFLREGLKFDDGTDLTAKDVAFTITLLHDPSYGGGTDITEAQVVGGLEYKEGDAEDISGIRVVDDRTIEIEVEEPNARSLTMLGGQVLSEAYYGANYEKGDIDYLSDLHLKPLGAGPFRFDEYNPGQHIRYVANEYYYAGKPSVDTFIYRTTEGDSQQFFQTGELDYSAFPANRDNYELLESMEFANINVYNSSNYSYIAFNNESEVFEDPLVRQAFIHGLDRETIIAAHYQGFAEVANVPVAPTSWAYTDEIEAPTYDPELAKELLEEAGWEEGSNGIREKDGERLRVYYYTSAGGLGDTLIPIAQENYSEIGIDLQVEQMDFNALLARVDAGDHDLASFSTTMQPDPHVGVQAFHSTHTGATFRGYENDDVDRLIEASVGTNDQDERIEAYHELYQALQDDPPMILLNYNKVLSGTNARVDGFEPNGVRGITPSLEHLEVVDVTP